VRFVERPAAPAAPGGEPVIRFTGVTKRFGGRPAVRDLTVEVRSGEVTALLGPNGSGKTTTLKMAAGLIRADAGAVTVAGVSAWSSAARHCLSYLPQRVAFPDALSGREVVEFYRRLRGAPDGSTDAVLKFASLNGASGRPVGTYSGGMVQRLGLAVATLSSADALLLDEPTAALDPQGLSAFYALVDRDRERRAVLFTSHQVADVDRIADRVLVLSAGTLVTDMSRSAVQEWRDRNGTMRLHARGAAAAGGGLQGLAPGLRIDGDDIIVTGPARDRAAILETIRRAGLAVDRLVAEPAPLEAWYADVLSGGAT
jgi:Cu-processing system ATP-binding protein